MNDIIVATWGIGQVYRDRVKHNIRKAMATGYDKVMPYVILTDNVDYFDDLKSEFPDKILTTINIITTRHEFCQWDSGNFEHIVLEDDPVKYGKAYREDNWKLGKRFSYGLNRFSLPIIWRMGFKKILMCDSDTDIRYDLIGKDFTEAEFWAEFDTPVNTMKGCDLETFDAKEHYDDAWRFSNVVISNILKYEIGNRFDKYRGALDIMSRSVTQTEGPFRFYHFKNVDDVIEYFKIWDWCMYIMLTTKQLNIHCTAGTYMYIDNIPFTTAALAMGIKALNFPKKYHKVNIYKADRHFYPKGHAHDVNGESLSLQPHDDKEEFLRINAKLINYLKSRGEWDE